MLTVKQCADRMGVSPKLVYRLIQTKELPAFKFAGSVLRVAEPALAEYMERCQTSPPELDGEPVAVKRQLKKVREEGFRYF